MTVLLRADERATWLNGADEAIAAQPRSLQFTSISMGRTAEPWTFRRVAAGV